jgi:hypothetical protein
MAHEEKGTAFLQDQVKAVCKEAFDDIMTQHFVGPQHEAAALNIIVKGAKFLGALTRYDWGRKAR